MAQEKPLTPERQLLNLIEGASEKSSQASLKAEEVKHRSLSLLSAQAWSGRISFFRQEYINWLQSGGIRRIDIKDINKILGFCVFILSICFFVNFFISAGNFRKIPRVNIKIKEPLKKNSNIESQTVLKALAYYLEKVRSRDIFIMGERPQPEAGGKAFSKPSLSRVTEVTQSLKLVGISWSNDPDVMLEDTKAQKTYFLKKGQIMDSNNVKVEAIFKDKVVLSFEGAEIELK